MRSLVILQAVHASDFLGRYNNKETRQVAGLIASFRSLVLGRILGRMSIVEF